MRRDSHHRPLQGLTRDQDGWVAVMMAVWMLVIFGFVGLAAEGSAYYTIQMRMQTAADAAALNAALTHWRDGGNYQAAAEDDAARNGFCVDLGDALCPPEVAASGIASEVDANLLASSIRVTITRSGGPFLFRFSRPFLDAPPIILAQAEAGLVIESLLCLLTLAPTGNQSLFLDSNSVLDARGCDIHVNSSGSQAVHIKSNSDIDANAICVVGNYRDESTGSITPTPDTGCAALADPLAGIAAPTVGSCNFNNRKLDSVTQTINPGVYCGGLEILGNANITFNPGTYVISGGKGLFVDSNSRITGNGVTFYLTNGAIVQFLSNSTFNLSAPLQNATVGVPGILFFEDRNNPTGLTHVIDSNSTGQILDGAFYFSRNKLKIDSNSAVSAQSSCMVVIAQQVEFNSNAVDLLTDLNQCANRVPGELFQSSITLLA